MLENINFPSETFGVGYIFLPEKSLNIYISGSLGLEGEINQLPCQASDWPSQIFCSYVCFNSDSIILMEQFSP
jgi:hypothetical protein